MINKELEFDVRPSAIQNAGEASSVEEQDFGSITRDEGWDY